MIIVLWKDLGYFGLISIYISVSNIWNVLMKLWKSVIKIHDLYDIYIWHIYVSRDYDVCESPIMTYSQIIRFVDIDIVDLW